MRLALTHAYGWPEVRRGAERMISELGRAMTKRGHDVTIYMSARSTEPWEGDTAPTVRYRRLFGRDWRHERHFGLRLIPDLVRHRYDTVHSLGPYDTQGSIRAARITGHRTVYTQLGIPWRAHWESKKARRAHDRAVLDVDAYGCMSRFALGVLAQDYGRLGVLMPGGVNLASFVPAERRTPEPTILFSAALDQPQKGGAVLLEAFALLLRTTPSARLWLSGAGDPSATLARAPAAVRNQTEVLPIGDAHAQNERYGRAWVTTLPSKTDSFGLVMIESLACGTPVAASNHSALPELVTPGENGYLCDPDDAASVAEALAGAIELSASPGIVERCRATAEPYDWDAAIAPMYERIYDGH